MYAKAKNISVQTTYFAINTQFVIIVSSWAIGKYKKPKYRCFKNQLQ